MVPCTPDGHLGALPPARLTSHAIAAAEIARQREEARRLRDLLREVVFAHEGPPSRQTQAIATLLPRIRGELARGEG